MDGKKDRKNGEINKFRKKGRLTEEKGNRFFKEEKYTIRKRKIQRMKEWTEEREKGRNRLKERKRI
jgi:hypothetical protein